MPFNGSGTFTRNYNWVNDKIAGTPITASRMDAEFDNYANGLGQTITKDGQTILTGNIPFNNYKITGLGNGSARNDSIALGQVQDGSYTYLGTTTGSADAYTVAPAPTITAYATTQRFFAKIHATNTTTTPYLQISAIANPTTTAVIKKLSATKTEIALEASDLIANGLYEFQRNSANDAWIVLNPEKSYYNLINATKATSTAQGILALTPNKIITLSNNATDATNDIDVGAGWFNFDDGSGQAYYSGGTGQLDVLFSAGGNGMLDTGPIANTTYHIFLIYNPTTLVSKILASTSVSSPTMPSGYTKKARIGSIIRASGAILPFSQSDKRFMHRLNRLDRSTTLAAPASPTNLPLTVPNGISVDALVTVYVQELGSVGGAVLVCDTNYTDLNASLTNFSALISTPGGSQQANTTALQPVRTNTSAQVNIDGSNTTVSLGVITNGWIDYQLNY